MKESDKIKNGEGDSSGKKRGKETKVSFLLFLFVKCLVSLICNCLYLVFKVTILLRYLKNNMICQFFIGMAINCHLLLTSSSKTLWVMKGMTNLQNIWVVGKRKGR